MKYHFSCLIVGALLFCTGCSSFYLPTKKVNPVLQDPHFQQVFANRKIKLVAPASGFDPEKLQQLGSLKQLNIQIPDQLLSDDIIYHANNDEQRFQFLKDALFDKSKNTIVWSLRGGYGSARLIDRLKKLPKPKHEKVFIGYSDITALHLFLSQQWQWKTIHGSGLSAILSPDQDPQNFQKIADIISKKTSTLKINALMPLNKLAEKKRKISGRITGGNLSIIQTSVGTDWQIKADKKILFLEDTEMKGYQVDRILNQLNQAGVFKKTNAIIFGEFTNDGDEFVNLALERFARDTHIPVFKTNQFGHGRVNHPLVYTVESDIVANSDGLGFELRMHLF